MASGSGEMEGTAGAGARLTQHWGAQAEEFQFYLITPSSAKGVIGLVLHENGSRPAVVNFSEMEAPDGSKHYLRNTKCWQPCGLTATDVGRFRNGSSIKVTPFFSQNLWEKVGTVLDNATKLFSQDLPYAGKMDGQGSETFALRSGRLQIEMYRGSMYASRPYGHSMWMAFVTNVVLLSNPYNFVDCLLEYAHHRPMLTLTSIGVNTLLKKSAEWFLWVQQDSNIRASSSVGTSHGTEIALALIISLNLIRSRHQAGFLDLDGKLLVTSYEALLSPLSEAVSVICSSESMPPWAAEELQVGVGHIVAVTSQHSVDWTSYLDAFCSADPSYSFLGKWTAKRDALGNRRNA